jgi:hypothetical protein
LSRSRFSFSAFSMSWRTIAVNTPSGASISAFGAMPVSMETVAISQ